MGHAEFFGERSQAWWSLASGGGRENPLENLPAAWILDVLQSGGDGVLQEKCVRMVAVGFFSLRRGGFFLVHP